jgi:hypothetical protein
MEQQVQQEFDKMESPRPSQRAARHQVPKNLWTVIIELTGAQRKPETTVILKEVSKFHSALKKLPARSI